MQIHVTISSHSAFFSHDKRCTEREASSEYNSKEACGYIINARVSILTTMYLVGRVVHDVCADQPQCHPTHRVCLLMHLGEIKTGAIDCR